MPVIKILAVGDVVGEKSVAYLQENLKKYSSSAGADLVIVNGENSASSNGIDPDSAKNLFGAGADVITTGNHVWRKNNIKDYLDTEQKIIRPANYPPHLPGSGYTVAYAKGYRILVINVLGTVYMEPLSCPFEAAQKILTSEAGKYDAAIIDVHAEATSEKMSIAVYFDELTPSKRVAAVFGTHTHVQTSDARILKNGTGFITDLGMTGPDDSVLGIKSAGIIEKLKNKMPARFEVAEGKTTAHGAIFEIDVDTAKTISAQFIKF